MLSIEAVSSGGDYHGYLLTEYYLGESRAGRWAGRGAHALGLTGDVDAKTFAQLADGLGKDGKPLVQNAGVRVGERARDCGWDLTFSAPKDVSVLWAVADQETSGRIRACHEAAVAESLDYLEAAAGRSRQSQEKGRGVVETAGKLVIATFGHGASREKDPQLHTHCVTFNVAVRDDGSTGAVVSKPLYRHKMAAGAVYQATLAAELTRVLGVKLASEKHGFRVEGIPEQLSRDFSKRRAQIERALAARNAHSAQAAAAAAKQTRKQKSAGHEVGLFEQWREAARECGFTHESVSRLTDQVKAAAKGREQHVARAVACSASKLLEHDSYFGEKSLVRESANRLRDGTAAGREIREAVTAWLARPDVVTLGAKQGEVQFTTRAVIGQEKALIADASRLAARQSHAVTPRALANSLRAFPERGVSQDDAERNKGQRAAVERLTSRGGLSVLVGMAGTGKSTVLNACREAWEQSGYRVTGVAIQGKTAKNLQATSGIESETVALRLAQLEGRGLAGSAWHHLKQVVKTAANELHRDVNLPVHRPKSFTLDAKTVVVLDEAGMVGTGELGRLLRAVRGAGAKLVLAGDAKQLQPIGAGAPFPRIEKEVGAAKLTHITRQKLDLDDRLPAWRRAAVTLFAAGQAGQALAMFGERGFVAVEGNRDKARQKLVSEWVAGGGLARPGEHLILAGTNEDVRTLNALCQKERLGRSTAGQTLHAAEVNGESFFAGDRVLFTKKSRSLGIDNGEVGTVECITGTGARKALSVTVDDGRTVTVPLAEYADIRLGFATTTHKAQGLTVRNAYVLLGGRMQDRHMSYVQASRAVETTRFFTDRYEAGPELSTIAKKMAQPREKEMAHDLADRAGPRRGRGHEHEGRA